ncbi:hypothetical protein ACCO45_012018 [Purpureocillium lilacinum]|uniref:Uncharacterized protein n=1 Tax=Purpureocillium lilacinum TaxID=33203 RepID=A0ACC4DE05_PURLI
MPPKSRPLSRTSSRGRPRQASQFGELETTPTSRCHESPRPVSSHAAGSETQLIEDIADLMTDIDRQGPQLADAGDISATAPADVGVGCSATFAWSDTARRSSPLIAATRLSSVAPVASGRAPSSAETPSRLPEDNIYDATPREDVSAKCDRPDVDQPQLPGESSSVANDPAGQDDKHLSDEAAPSTENHDSGLIITRNIANKAAKRLEKGKKSVPITEVPGSSAVIPSSGSVQGAASKRYSNKRKQRAKPPLEFDAASHDFKGPPHSAAMKSKARMPIVNALRESVQLSSSPATQARKRQEPPTSSSQPKKRARATRKKVQAASTVEVSTGASSAPTNQEMPIASQSSGHGILRKAEPHPPAIANDPVVLSSEPDSDESYAPSSPPHSPRAHPADDFRDEPVAKKPLAKSIASATVAVVKESRAPSNSTKRPRVQQSGGTVKVDQPQPNLTGSSQPAKPPALNARGGNTNFSSTKQESQQEAQTSRTDSGHLTRGKANSQVHHRKHECKAPTRTFSVSVHGSPIPAPLEPSQGRYQAYTAPRPHWPMRFSSIVGLYNDQIDDTSRTRISEEVQAQILASLRDLKTPSEQEGSDTGTDESEAMDGSIEPAPKPAPVTTKDQVAQELHSVVDMMMDTISSKEVEGFDVAKTYQEKILNCVDRIESRQSRERDAAFSRAEEDFGLFRSLIGDAKTLIKGKRQARERTMRDLEETVAKRKKQIDHATSKLGNLGQDDSDAAVAP